ncbi:MAG: hypothetical protein CME63_16485 [Halobacteriovoraceae bacterium]|nr:hypothetical protein [Halobacteriovoraceae bacterium]|tara:strand:- start:14601 stop:16082 length:1482 start_codon:yes stop_codon:yes gene_type:complete
MIQRHKTAIRRNKLSRPVNYLIDRGLLSKEMTFFDYGCGHGQDLQILEKNGFGKVNGWDPYFKPQAEKVSSDIVNLGYVLNVIEKTSERRDALMEAYAKAEKLLCVSVMTKSQKGYEGQEHGDGVLSSRGTFQKYYDQSEIKNYLESTLNTDAISAEPGIFLIFKSEKEKLSYLDNRYNRPVTLEVTRLDPITREPRKVRVFKPKLEELIKESAFIQPVMEFVLKHGRVPSPLESDDFKSLIDEFKSKRKIENIILDNIDEEEFLDIRARRIEEILVFFALRRFDKHGFPKKSDLPLSLELDIKSFFTNYKDCLNKATQLLFSLGNDRLMREAHKHITIGKVLPDAVYIHPSYVKELPAPIQVKVGVAQTLLGEIEGCNLLKINKMKEKVSFMVYEDFQKFAHPALLYTVVVDLPKLTTKLWDFELRENPPILHRKETFVGEDFPGYEKFRKLTKQEESKDLLSRNDIGTRKRWEAILEENGLKISGHTLKKL